VEGVAAFDYGMKRNPRVGGGSLVVGGGGRDRKRRMPPNTLYKAALRLILGPDPKKKRQQTTTVSTIRGNNNDGNSTVVNDEDDEDVVGIVDEEVQKAAEVLYTLLHARYISSPMGMGTVRRMMSSSSRQTTKNATNRSRLGGGGDSGGEQEEDSDGIKAIFGRCPRMQCGGMPLLPYGTSNEYDVEGLRKGMKYCCSCGEAFYSWDSKVDGSAWGPYFCHLFAMTHGAEIFPMLSLWNNNNKNTTNHYCHQGEQQRKNSGGGGQQMTLDGEEKEGRNGEGEEGDDNNGKPVPKIFGFRVHPEAMVRYPIF